MWVRVWKGELVKGRERGKGGQRMHKTDFTRSLIANPSACIKTRCQVWDISIQKIK